MQNRHFDLFSFKSESVVKKRANSDQDKREKSAMIIKTTLDLYSENRQILTATEIAKEAKIGKGTLYSYFKTTEEIYMTALVDNFGLWHKGIRDFVLDESPSELELLEFLCRSLTEFTIFVDLISISSNILEENLDIDYLRKAKLSMKLETSRTSELLSKVFPGWIKEDTFRNMRRFYIYGVAFWKECFPSASLQEALPEDYGSNNEQREKFFGELFYLCRMIWRV